MEGDFALAISLYHGYDLLQQHGLRSLQSYLLSIVSGDKGYGRTRAELLRNSDFTDMMEDIKKFAPVKYVFVEYYAFCVRKPIRLQIYMYHFL